MGVRSFFNKWSIQEVHFTSWLIKDVFWCLKFKWLATFMVFPTIFLTIFILIKEKENRGTNLILTSWVLMNIFWMLHELQNFPQWIITVCMVFGGLTIANSLKKKSK